MSSDLSDVKNILLQQKVEQLQCLINTNRIFMNMVIHDMRNPTGSIEFGMQQSLDNLEQYLLRFQALKEVFQVYLVNSESIYSGMLDQSDPSISNSNNVMF
jgi:hypothetical protein